MSFKWRGDKSAFVSYSDGIRQKAPISVSTNQRKPLSGLTLHIAITYRNCNPGAFSYTTSMNPRRVITKPSQGLSNNNYDNKKGDLIIYVNDILGLNRLDKKRDTYLVLNLLGNGTFGQVVQCSTLGMDQGKMVAIKVIKNKPAYHKQGVFEVEVLKMLAVNFDNDKNNMVELIDTFYDRNHLCLVFELLNVNLLDLLKQNNFRGVSTTLVRTFVHQILVTLRALYSVGLIHCDLKPENILLRDRKTPSIKVIDFGSACFEQHTIYSYIQSRYYRAPEVIIGYPYTRAIDMWSLGCVAAELFLGLPLFPGHNGHNQLFRIIELIGPLPQNLLDKGKNASIFFNKHVHPDGFHYTLKSEKQWASEQNTQAKEMKRWFKFKRLEGIENYPYNKRLSPAGLAKEKMTRKAFIDFLQGVLQLDPAKRWTAEQASKHPFITGEPFVQPFVPDPPPDHSPFSRPIRGDVGANRSFFGHPSAANAGNYSGYYYNRPQMQMHNWMPMYNAPYGQTRITRSRSLSLGPENEFTGMKTASPQNFQPSRQSKLQRNSKTSSSQKNTKQSPQLNHNHSSKKRTPHTPKGKSNSGQKGKTRASRMNRGRVYRQPRKRSSASFVPNRSGLYHTRSNPHRDVTKHSPHRDAKKHSSRRDVTKSHSPRQPSLQLSPRDQKQQSKRRSRRTRSKSNGPRKPRRKSNPTNTSSTPRKSPVSTSYSNRKHSTFKKDYHGGNSRKTASNRHRRSRSIEMIEQNKDVALAGRDGKGPTKETKREWRKSKELVMRNSPIVGGTPKTGELSFDMSNEQTIYYSDLDEEKEEEKEEGGYGDEMYGRDRGGMFRRSKAMDIRKKKTDTDRRKKGKIGAASWNDQNSVNIQMTAGAAEVGFQPGSAPKTGFVFGFSPQTRSGGFMHHYSGRVPTQDSGGTTQRGSYPSKYSTDP